MVSLFIHIINYSKSCVSSFFVKVRPWLSCTAFWFLMHFSLLFFSLEDRKTCAFIISLRWPTFNIQYTKLTLVLHAFITGLCVVISFHCISGLLHTCQSMIFFFFNCTTGSGQAHCVLDVASHFIDSFFIHLEYNLKQYFKTLYE